FFSSRRRHTRLVSDWSSDVCSSDLAGQADDGVRQEQGREADEGRGDRPAAAPAVRPGRQGQGRGGDPQGAGGAGGRAGRGGRRRDRKRGGEGKRGEGGGRRSVKKRV